MALSDAQIAMRQKLGLAEDADEATVLAALDEALEERADPPASPPATPVVASAPDQPAAQAQPAPAGTMVIDSSAWEAREERLRRLEATENKRRREERDQVINQAVAEGKFQNARVEHWQRLWDADPEGTRQVIDGLARGIVPVNELGFSGSLDDRAIDDEFGHLFPPSYSKES